MKIIRFIYQSLTIRLSFWVFVCVVALFIASLGVLFHYSRIAVKEEAVQKASQTLEGTLLHVEGTLHDVEVAANNMKWLVEQNISQPDSMFMLSRQILENNPNLYGCSIAFEPFFYPEKGRYFSAYSYNGGDSIQTEQEGNDLYEYYCMDWFLIPKLLDKPYWVEPFQEFDTGGIQVSDAMTSFCQPIHDKSGRVVGVLSVDLSLKWFSKTISEVKPFPNSYSILLGKGGTFLVHPDTTRLFLETIFTHTLEEPDTALTALGKAMISKETGYKRMMLDGKEHYVFYRPFLHTDWSVGIVCSEQDIFEPYKSLQRYLAIITVVGLLLLLVFCVVIIRYNLWPLKKLALSALDITKGYFDKIIPDSTRSDEIGHLQQAFSKMQQSLVTYIAKIRHSTATLTERNLELSHTNELAREADRMKAAFVSNMTDQMAKPVSIIASESEALRVGHKNFSDEEMRAHVDRMLDNTELVTSLLNQLLDTSENEVRSVLNEDKQPQDLQTDSNQT